MSTGKEVAVKRIDTSKVPSNRVELELDALKNLRHPSIVDIVEFYEQFKENGSQYIVMEYCKHRSLRDYVKQNGQLNDYSAAHVLRQLVAATKYIHENGMIHRDISSGNVLISDIRNEKFGKKLKVKLSDFGLATYFYAGDIARTMLGTPGYIAPQVFGKKYDQKADIFSLGGILYLMLAGKDPPLKFDNISPEGVTLIKEMMQPTEESRINLGGITMSSFMRKADEMDLHDRTSWRGQSKDGFKQSSYEVFFSIFKIFFYFFIFVLN
ncbi:unnamed protein product [Dracunculus medinensis]|uniref:Protein kinase domain-containing protein n=1 Tax=Dracunculus medinensis TaxID=318479 RepID=A0A3P7Q0I8_DRAME|nr:unnamed protein product [Dracunculus medinensis]